MKWIVEYHMWFYIYSKRLDSIILIHVSKFILKKYLDISVLIKSKNNLFLLIVSHNGLIWINISSLFANFVTRNTCFFVKGLRSFARVFRLFAKVLRLYCNNFIYHMIDSFLALWLIGSNPTISNKQNVIFTRTWPMRSI